MGDSKNFVMTPHRAKVLEALLREGGAVEDPAGQATPLLKKYTGHKHTNSLSGVLSQIEEAGLIQRDMNGRRTYRIALTREGRATAERLLNSSAAERTEWLTEINRLPEPSPAAEVEAVLNGAVDLDLLAGVLLKKALVATQAQEQSAGAKDAEARAQRAEVELAAARDELAALRREMAELKAVVKTLEHNNKVLTTQMDKVQNNPGTPIKELISKREQQELAKLMRQLPSLRG